MLSTLVPPTSGTARINGLDIIREPDGVRKVIGVVFQDPSSDELLTGYENLKLHGWLYDMPDGLEEARIKEVLSLIGLVDRKDDLVKKYSGGMRRRLEFARGLLHHPRVLFLDEPTIGLDPQSRDRMWEYITALREKENITVVITTHYMEEADRLCDRVAIIDNGRIVALDTPERLKRGLGGDIVELWAEKPEVDALRGLGYVLDVSCFDGGVRVVVDDAARHLQGILSVAGRVDSVEVRSPTLDDVFIHYTGRDIRDGSPEGGWSEKVMHVRDGR